MLSFDFGEIFKNTFFKENLRVTTFDSNITRERLEPGPLKVVNKRLKGSYFES